MYLANTNANCKEYLIKLATIDVLFSMFRKVNISVYSNRVCELEPPWKTVIHIIVFEASPRRQGVAEAPGIEGATTYTRMASA